MTKPLIVTMMTDHGHVRMSSSPADSCLLFYPQLRLSPTLLSSYDPYDDMIFMFMTHALGLPPSHHHHDFTSHLPHSHTTLWEVPFGRSSLGGGRSSSIRSGSLSSPFVFGLGDVPRRTRLPLKISVYSRLPDLPRLEPSPIVYGRQLRLRPISAPFDGLAVYPISIIISLIGLISVTMITGDHRLPTISIAYASFPWSVHAYASLSLTVPNMYKHGLCA